MSADNYIAVMQRPTDGKWLVTYGFASPDGEDCQYIGTILSDHDSRPKALTAAHDRAKLETILEYGVSEQSYPPREPCGRCFVCIHERNIVADDVRRCDRCEKPISYSEWAVSTNTGTYHPSCEPQKRSLTTSAQ